MWISRGTRRKITAHPASMTRRQPVALAFALGLASFAWVYSAHASPITAQAAHTLNVTDEAHLHLTGTSGEQLEEEGPATGALPGKARAQFVVSSSVNGSFTFYPHGGGSITGHGSARLHSTGTIASFSGSIAVSHGTGRYAHAHGSGGFSGTVNRRTDALTVKTTGRLSY